MIPYARQEILNQDIEAVAEVLKSDFLTQGPVVPRFEQAVADYCGAGQAVAVNSATSALHIACLALGLGPGDWLWTSPNTFAASANCGLYCGARIDFVDIDPRTYNLCPIALERKLVDAEQSGKLPSVLVPVHFAGQSCDMESICVLSKRFGFRIVEDASHSIGGMFQGKPVGSCLYSDITVFSFHAIKIITSAEGGMALTNDSELHQRMLLFRNHGITRDRARWLHKPTGPWYYEQIELGYNYRMTDVQAALGLSQLDRLNSYVMRRQELAQRYNSLLVDLPVQIPWQHSSGSSAWHLYVVRLQRDKIKPTHRRVFESLHMQGVGVNLHYIPVHTHPYYQGIGFQNGDYPETERYYQEAISLPMHPTLSETQQDDVIAALKVATQT